jgi:hypothetical protein
VLGTGSVFLHLIKVLFSRSLGLSSFGVKVNTDLGQGFLRNPCLLPHGKRLLSMCDPPPALGDSYSSSATTTDNAATAKGGKRTLAIITGDQ